MAESKRKAAEQDQPDWLRERFNIEQYRCKLDFLLLLQS